MVEKVFRGSLRENEGWEIFAVETCGDIKLQCIYPFVLMILPLVFQEKEEIVLISERDS